MAKLERRPTGMGKKPALLVVDAINAFTDPECPLGTRVDVEIGAIRTLLGSFRKLGLPIYFTSQAYTDASQASVWREKLPSVNWLKSGTRWVDVDPRLEPGAGETVIVKHAPSAFFDTDLKRRLLADGVDTVFVVGFTTSGCVRASAVDSVSGNFRTIVVPEGCGDRDPAAHAANLYDLDAKYADLIPLEDAVEMLEELRAARAVT
jgi:nicotinamidase-related amidase